MRLSTLVKSVHDAFEPDLAMADVATVSEHDRYQASAGIAAAAAYVAERAAAAGLADVRILSFPADGAQRWWTYRSPLSWTPVRASIALGDAVLLRYPEQPYTLAAYSAPVPRRRIPVVRWSKARGCPVARGALVVADDGTEFGAVAGALGPAGAVAVAADPLAGRTDRLPGQTGRLELRPGSRLAGFSLAPGVLRALLDAADRGDHVAVEVAVDQARREMPVVTGCLPCSEESGEEMLLSAHLCHPRPGANDNASGVAALLGAARVLTRKDGPGAEPGPGIRFLWGPEFTGVAAYLHDVVMAGAARPPVLAVNVDMAGQDVTRCGGPLVIERGPDDIPSFLPALAERCAGLLPARRSYSGAVPCDPWTWRAVPFAGGSDHALLADDPVRSAVIALGHWPDRANHSSADTPELVDPAELRRTAVIACATVAAVRGRADPGLSGDIADAALSWAAARILAVLPGQRPARPAEAAGPDTIDPLADGSARRLLKHRSAVSREVTRSVSAAGLGPEWVRSAQAWVASVAQVVMDRLPPAAPVQSTDARAAGGAVLERRWTGPATLRALMAAARPEDSDWLASQLAADRGGNYARATALMRAVNGSRDRPEVTWWAALSSELPITEGFASRFLGILGAAGWTSGGGCE
jgi:hypothetical protein